MRLRILGALLAAAIALIVAGVAVLSTSAALVTAGLLVAGWAWLFFGDIGSRPE